MLAKGGLILLIAAFGALMFGAGALAPETMRAPLAALLQRVGKPVPKPPEKKGDAPAAAAKEELLRAEALLVPTPTPAKGQYALQLGQFAAASDADALAKRARALGSQVALLQVADREERPWWILASGVYGSPEDARAARRGVPPELELPETLAVILLPPPKPKADAKDDPKGDPKAAVK